MSHSGRQAPGFGFRAASGFRPGARSPEPGARQATRRGIALAVTLVCSTAVVLAQPQVRRATSQAALIAFPGFFQGQPVVVRGTLETRDRGMMLMSPLIERALPVIFQGPSPPDGRVELRATFFDVGRLDRFDPRIQNQGLGSFLPTGAEEGNWPRPGDIYALVATSGMSVQAPGFDSSLRTVVLEPSAFEGQRVTIAGQFRGRNLYGDLPQAPQISRWDFVLRSADAAIWVTGQRPRGRGFNLDITRRIDTGHWLEVAGVVRQGKGVTWVEATQVTLGTAPAETFTFEAPDPPPVGPAPEVIFSDPAEGETDVPSNKVVRLQFSRDMKPESFERNVRGRYRLEEPPQSGQPDASSATLTQRYDPANRSIEIRIEADPSSFRGPITIELGEGITATDGAALKPWSLTFTFGP